MRHRRSTKGRQVGMQSVAVDLVATTAPHRGFCCIPMAEMRACPSTKSRAVWRPQVRALRPAHRDALDGALLPPFRLWKCERPRGRTSRRPDAFDGPKDHRLGPGAPDLRNSAHVRTCTLERLAEQKCANVRTSSAQKAE